jgi:hypothetical protein
MNISGPFRKVKPQRRKSIGKKSKKQEEIIEVCDHCGKPLKSHQVRTNGSAVIALSEGIPARNRGGEWQFFCSLECAADSE